MGKQAALLLSVSGAMAVSAAGIFIGRGPGPLSPDIPFSTLEDFKAKKGGPCVQRHFSDLDFATSGSGISALSNSSKIEDSDFAGDGEVGSCLVVNWDRTDATNPPSTDGKWKGTFKWLWSFAKGNSGIISFNFTSLSTEDKKMEIGGGIYLVERKEPKGKWTVKKYQELTSKVKVGKSEFESKFPKVGTALTGSLESVDAAKKNHWGFVSGKEEVDKICKFGDNSHCPQSGTTKSFRGSWLWHPNKDEKTITLDKWNDNLTNHWSGLYGNDKFSLSTTFGNLKGS